MEAATHQEDLQAALRILGEQTPTIIGAPYLLNVGQIMPCGIFVVLPGGLNVHVNQPLRIIRERTYEDYLASLRPERWTWQLDRVALLGPPLSLIHI